MSYPCEHPLVDGMLDCPQGCVDTTNDATTGIPPIGDTKIFSMKELDGLLNPRLDEMDEQFAELRFMIKSLPDTIDEQVKLSVDKHVHKRDQERAEKRKKMIGNILLQVKKFFPFTLAAAITSVIYELGNF